MAFQPLTVTEVNQYIKQMLEQDQILSQVSVRGELSNYKMHSSGHHYFTLKDDGAVISAVMFRGDASKLRFRPENGMKVILSSACFPRVVNIKFMCGICSLMVWVRCILHLSS